MRSFTIKIVSHLFPLFLLFSAQFAHPKESPWTIKTRIQHGVEYDDNIEESRDSTQSDGLMKFVLSSRLKYFQNKWFIQLNYHGGMQYYFASPFENKFSHDVYGTINYLQSPRVRMGGNFHTRIKTFSRRNWDYVLSDCEAFLSFIFGRYQLSFYYTLQGLNYLNYDQFDFGVHKFALALQRRMGRYNSIQLKVCRQKIDFTRYALSYDPVFDEIFVNEKKQNDKNSYLAIQWRHQKKWLFSTEYLFQNNSSNSYGFSYRFHRITLSTASHFRFGILLRLFAGWQRKKYAEALDKLVATELDSEREKSNFFILDISKDITKRLTTFFRFSYYYNESPIPGSYYPIRLSSCSLEYLFYPVVSYKPTATSLLSIICDLYLLNCSRRDGTIF